jgi:glycosyltransferase involved in cell wall biosynthesis
MQHDDVPTFCIPILCIPKRLIQRQNDMLSARLHKFILVLNSHLTIFEPTHIIFNDSLSLKATTAMHYGGDAFRVFVIHCAEQLPFGPYAGGLADSSCSPKERDLLHGVDAIWSVSNAVKDYAAEHGQLDTTFLVHDPWTYLDERKHQVPDRYYNWDRPVIGMINPSQVKGVEILLSLAKELPHRQFAAWRSWGADDAIEQKLEAVPNIELRPTCRNMEDAWKDIKILLVPSLWLEAWGMVVVEAQLRGIPVISSDSGALPEAKLGIAPIIPVNSLTGKHDRKGDYVVPKQDISGWVEVVETLMNDRGAYEALADQARDDTASWLMGLDEHALEHWLEGIER